MGLGYRVNMVNLLSVFDNFFVHDDDDDPNAETCVDPALRSAIKSALNRTEEVSCKGIVNTLVSSLNRPGWAINCVRLGDLSVDTYFKDFDFCFYMAELQSYDLFLRLAKIDYI
ncbi:hypothetical protein ANCDUO_05212 [Ancylostoma duodenale]|uniref:Uncharacterized protein n=1 Tax=Ancylostoma duodenale TaxID=51022 RepID=A0A0C2GZ72_9BILA|nr:hypothetical protein ANCDUO_05212 [Ancylostoma duodenale]